MIDNYHLTVRLFKGPAPVKFLVTCLSPILDRILGIHRLDDIYQRAKKASSCKKSFVENALETLETRYEFDEELLAQVPKEGPVIFAANHPFGAVDGLILSQLISKVRPDVKILANSGLSLIPELKDYFIFTNPLRPNNPKNVRSLKECMKHLKDGHALGLFPAGAVSCPQDGLHEKISDREWNNLLVKFAKQNKATVIPVHFSGQNSPWFYRLGQMHERFRLLMLAREAGKTKGKVKVSLSKPITYSTVQNYSDQQAKDYYQMRCYLAQEQVKSEAMAFDESQLEPLMEPVDSQILKDELASLPEDSHLVDYRHFSVYQARRSQAPNIVTEIGRLRERTYRDYKEGSGQAADNDDFDDTYIQLFIWDNDKDEIIGAYRMGAVKELMKENDKSELYLSSLFDYPDAFLKEHYQGLETGRSFIVREHQKKPYGLMLLWQGIANYVANNPDLTTLFGTVSLSTEYDPRSIALMHKVLVGKDYEVPPIDELETELPAEVESYIDKYSLDLKELSTLVKSIEADGKDIPILVKQYLKLGGVFKSIAIDKGFANTPGAFVLVDLRKTPDKVLKMYMGDRLPEYREYHSK